MMMARSKPPDKHDIAQVLDVMSIRCRLDDQQFYFLVVQDYNKTTSTCISCINTYFRLVATKLSKLTIEFDSCW